MSEQNREPIAVVGIGAIFPGTIGKGGFWMDVVRGTDRMTDVPPTHWLIDDYYDPDPRAPDKVYAKRGAFLPDVDFDPMEWGIPPANVPATDTCQLLALIVAKQVLDDAGRAFDDGMKDRTSVILGVTSAQELLGAMVSRLQHPIWAKALRESGIPEDEVEQICERLSSHYVDWQENTFPGVLGNVVAGRIANRLGLGGTNCVTDAACASSLAALQMGINELRLGDSDVVVTGGADTMNDIFMYECFSKTTALSPTGDCRPFSDQADGTMLGEGIGMLALKRLADAEAAGDAIYAVIRGVGTSSDGRAKSVYAPVPAGQAKALRRAYAQTDYGPGSVELLEAHGTGTKAGDAAEFEALATVFDESGRVDRGYCALGSVKSQVGHTKAAAGAAGLIKAALALHHRVLPPTIKIDRPNPLLAIDDSPFHLSTRVRPWVRGPEHPRRASVSSFGFGGSNFHIALEEYTGKGPRPELCRAVETELVIVTGDTPADVARRCDEMTSELRPGRLHELARRSQQDYSPDHAARLAVVAKDEDDLRARLERAKSLLAAGEPFDAPGGIHFGTGSQDGGVALLFPGQGSPYLHMGAELASTWPAAANAWNLAASQPLADDAGLHTVVFPPTAFDEETAEAQNARLVATEWAQPAIGAVSLSMLALLRQVGLHADAAAGHSFGELTALHAASVLSAEDLLLAARRRGEWMRGCSETPGAMLAIHADLEPMRARIDAMPDVVVANHNSPKQFVLSGPVEAIERAVTELAADGVKGTRLPVSTAFHSELVSGAVEPYREFLAGLAMQTPELPVYSNADGRPFPSEPDAIRDRLARQIAAPVRFVDQVLEMADAGIRTFIEVGPSGALSGLVSEILEGRTHRTIALDRRGTDGVTGFHQGLARLVAAGVAFDPAALWDGFEVQIVEQKKRHVLKINGANYGKPYPPPGGTKDLPRPNPRTTTEETRTTTPRESGTSATSSRPDSNGRGGARTATATAMERAPLVEPLARRAVPPPTAVEPREAMQMPAAPPAAPAGSAPMTNDAAWLAAWSEVQEQTARAHASYQQSMADAHSAYLSTARAALDALSGAPTAAAPLAPRSAAAAPDPVPNVPPMPPPPAVSTQPVVTAPVTEPTPMIEPAAAIAPASLSEADLLIGLRKAVAEKTGYPLDMVGGEMDLESDLGVDSIKRVEILAAVKDEHPSLPEFDAAELGALRTLVEIATFLRGRLPDEGAVPATPATNGTPMTTPAIDLTHALCAAVAEKTGYPLDMVSPDMDLESDLGVDSIKRVEILAAVKDAHPSLPDVDAAELGALRTLDEIAVHLRGLFPESDAPARHTPDASDLDANDLTDALRAAVAEKTGYPLDMVSADSDLESDLGVDSIKRVEILAAVKDTMPSLPEVDAAELGALRTLAEIAEHLLGTVGAGSSTSPETGPSVATEAIVSRFEVTPVPAPATGFAIPGLLTATRAVITDDHGGVAKELAAALRERGVAAEVVENVPDDADAVVSLAGLRTGTDPDSGIDACRAAFSDARAAAGRFERDGGLLVTVQDTGGDFGIRGSSRAWFGGIAGLLKTAAREWPGASLRALDVERADRDPRTVAGVIAAELLEGGDELEVGLPAAGERQTLASVERPAPVGEPLLGRGEVVLASGGARGVTAAALIELARRTGGRFALLGRTELTDEPGDLADAKTDDDVRRVLLGRGDAAPGTPDELRRQESRIRAGREIRATLAAIEAAGGHARYLAVDVRDKEALDRELAVIRSDWGGIRALVHGAGVLADKRIKDKTPEQFDRVFDTKVRGLEALLAATSEDDLGAILLFSSIAGRCGNPGQSDYAMANEVLNKVAAAERVRRGDACVVRSLNWGPWDGGMVSDALRGHFASLGIPLIPIQDGAARFADECVAPTDDHLGATEVVIGGDPAAWSAGATDAFPRLFELVIHRAAHPFLDGHRVRDVVVVPVVLVAEWFARAARICRPDLTYDGCTDLQVLRGIQIENFEQADGNRFRIEVKDDSSEHAASLAVALLDRDGHPRYRARAIMRNGEAAKTPSSLPALGDLAPWDEPVYGNALFHGAEFQVIRELDGVSKHGAAGGLVGALSVGWPKHGWQTDPALLDGGLQLAVLWTQQQLGGASLPTRVDQLLVYRPGLLEGALRGLVVGREAKGDRAICDIVLTDADGTAVAEMRGVETCVLPGTRRGAS